MIQTSNPLREKEKNTTTNETKFHGRRNTICVSHGLETNDKILSTLTTVFLGYKETKNNIVFL